MKGARQARFWDNSGTVHASEPATPFTRIRT